jgi:hypothetical protein
MTNCKHENITLDDLYVADRNNIFCVFIAADCPCCKKQFDSDDLAEMGYKLVREGKPRKVEIIGIDQAQIITKEKLIELIEEIGKC